MPNRVFIDAVGDHDPPHCHMIVDGVGTLVDLRDVAGPLSDPLVSFIEWGPFGEDYTPCGIIHRRSENSVASMIEKRKFPDISILGPYLEAYKRRLAEVHAKAD